MPTLTIHLLFQRLKRYGCLMTLIMTVTDSNFYFTNIFFFCFFLSILAKFNFSKISLFGVSSCLSILCWILNFTDQTDITTIWKRTWGNFQIYILCKNLASATVIHIQWSLYFKTTHGTKEMSSYIAGGLRIKVI